MIDPHEVIDMYQMRYEQRHGYLTQFFQDDGDTQFLIIPRAVNGLYTHCSSCEVILDENLQYLHSQLQLEYCDDLPHLEPWIGSGVYAQAFGSTYLWGEGLAPDTKHVFNAIGEVENLEYPDWRQAEIMKMVLDAIELLKTATEGKIPIGITDTQSPQDTASLILDTTELITGMYTHAELVHNLLSNITNLIKEFTHVQIQAIGESLLASPGHGFVGYPFLRGIGLSDDNMVISSPDFNQEYSFPYMNTLSDEFGGLALHSCGNWVKTMPRLTKLRNLQMIDFALAGNNTDPNPIPAAEAVEALCEYQGILKVRPGDDLKAALQEIEVLCRLKNRIIVDFPYTPETYSEYYYSVQDLLERCLG